MKKLVAWLRERSVWWWVSSVVVVGLAVCGVFFGLQDSLGWWVAIPVAAGAVLLAFARFNEVAGRIVGGVVIGTLALVGFNVIIDTIADKLGWDRPPIRPGLALAVVVFAFAAGWYLRGSERGGRGWGRGEKWDPWVAWGVAGVLAIALIIDVPILVQRVKDLSLGQAVGLAASMLGGLVVAVALCFFGAVWSRHGGRWNWAFAVSVAVIGAIVMAAIPIIYAQREKESTETVVEQGVASKVDVRLVFDGRRQLLPGRMPRPDPELRGFDVRYSVGYADGDSVRWTLVGTRDATMALRVASRGRAAPPAEAPPHKREGVQSVLAVFVDGTAPVIDPKALPVIGPARHESRAVARWRRIALAARERGMATYALLQTTSNSRLNQWRNFSQAGGPISIQDLGRRRATDTGTALGTFAPSARTDLGLAIEFRPILLFDTGEPVPRPLSVDWLFSDRRMTLCHDRGVTRTECDRHPLRDPRDLKNGGTPRLQVRPPDGDALKTLARAQEREAQQLPRLKPAARVPGLPAATVPVPAPVFAPRRDAPKTAIYVRPVGVERGHMRLLYLDYWWYLAQNPVSIGNNAFCGAGLVIPGVTCHNHQSDWEGMTVVVDRTNANKPRVAAVHYAQHDHVVRFKGDNLRRIWDTEPGMAALIGSAENGANRPLAFIAKGTHSTYPIPCNRKHCTQVVEASRGEARYGGELPWIGDYTAFCGDSSCVQLLPTQAGGRAPALWSAFEGEWGERHCALTYYCDSGSPPKAPGQQDRYQHPTDCDGMAVVSRGAGGKLAVKYHKVDSCE